jgi:hypothetical protein
MQSTITLQFNVGTVELCQRWQSGMFNGGSILSNFSTKFKAQEGHWFGLANRARRGDRWKGKLENKCIFDPNSSYVDDMILSFFDTLFPCNSHMVHYSCHLLTCHYFLTTQLATRKQCEGEIYNAFSSSTTNRRRWVWLIDTIFLLLIPFSVVGGIQSWWQPWRLLPTRMTWLLMSVQRWTNHPNCEYEY